MSAPGRPIDLSSVSPEITATRVADASSIPLAAGQSPVRKARPGGQTLASAVEQIEREFIHDALMSASGNISEAARRLGVSRVTLIDKMKKYGLASAKR